MSPRLSSSKGRLVWMLVLGILILSPSLILDGRSPSVVAQQWVAAHPRSLPSDIHEFAQYPLAYQRAIFLAHSPATKSHLMKERLRLALQTETWLDPAQRELILEMQSVMSPAVYANDTAALQRLADICTRSQELFTDATAHVLIPAVSPTSLTWRTPAPALRARVSASLYEIFVLSAEDCECNAEAPLYCTSCTWSGSACAPTGELGLCEEQPSGCGCGWAYECNGQCVG